MVAVHAAGLCAEEMEADELLVVEGVGAAAEKGIEPAVAPDERPFVGGKRLADQFKRNLLAAERLGEAAAVTGQLGEGLPHPFLRARHLCGIEHHVPGLHLEAFRPAVPEELLLKGDIEHGRGVARERLAVEAEGRGATVSPAKVGIMA